MSRKSWPFYLLVLLIFAALPVGWYVFLARPPPAPPPPPPAPEIVEAPQPVKVHLDGIEGTVEIRNPDGTWRAVARSDELRSADVIRTGERSSARLVGSDAWEVLMSSGTEVTVGELTASISRLMLANGMATATVRGEARHTFEVRAAGSDAVARTRSGVFAMSNDGTGTVAVGTREGEVELAAGGKVVIVRAGQQSLVRAGQAPSDPTSVPSSLLLKVKWPDRRLTRSRRLIVAGDTEPGAHVEVLGKVITADGNGRFSQSVQLSEGKNVVEVRATSVGGTTAKSDADLQVDTRGPGIGIDQNLWE
ncbi:MAG: FecR domain-containing protein [Myxococcaceae bacterium]